jgi:hypothetical protein
LPEKFPDRKRLDFSGVTGGDFSVIFGGIEGTTFLK